MYIKLGKVGKANLKANRELAKIWKEKGINYCEIRLPGCLGSWLNQNVHRHKRIWYLKKLDMLYDFKQVVRGCQHCHYIVEPDRELTESIFLKLRGDENNT